LILPWVDHTSMASVGMVIMVRHDFVSFVCSSGSMVSSFFYRSKSP
jgi:hypothetical protein